MRTRVLLTASAGGARRKESIASWATRLGTTVPTLLRMASGEPGVGIGLYATALWLIGRDAALAELASPDADKGALEMDVREAVAAAREAGRKYISVASEVLEASR